MAKKKKKISRKQLLNEPDEFITFTGKIIKWAIANQKAISWGLGAVLAAIMVFSGVRYFINTAENRSFALLQQSLTKYEALMTEKGQEKAYLETKEDFQQILKKYKRRKGGLLARVIYADICYNADNYDESIELYNQALQDFADNPPYKYLILKSLGYAYEGKKDFQAAAEQFEMIASSPDAIMKDEALFGLGRMYAATDQNEKSIDALKKLIADYPDSIYVEIAKNMIPG